MKPLVWVKRECRRGRLSLAEVKKTARAFLDASGFRNSGLSLLLVSDRRMRALNQRYLKHDYATDVLAFPLDAAGGAGPAAMAGEIIISLETALRQAPLYGHTFRQEFYFYLCHGILHLAGWEDDTPLKRARMFRRQENLLKKLAILKP